ncbi:SEL1-like repeat protein [Methylomicrobium lacus]|uniref:SEL1-like repeat protein n=1 Tax=Methylomicrobium lacus TaxID=136992 RepID=UPI00045E6571|nr:SEL1-like repeat protein [Methylomicrobium lacus]
MENSQDKSNKDKALSNDVFGFDLDEFEMSLNNGGLQYNLAIEKLIREYPGYENGMEDMVEAAKKGNQDALNWLVNAGIQIVVPYDLWEKNNIQQCWSFVLTFCKGYETGPHSAMARFFLGLLYLAGKGVASNKELAISNFKKAAEGPFLDELGNDGGFEENLGEALINMYLDVFSDQMALDENDINAELTYRHLEGIGNILCNGLSGDYPFLWIDKYFILSLRLNVFIRSGEYLLAEEHIEGFLKEVTEHERILFEPFREVLFQQLKLDKTNQSLKAKESELEETMAMFAHKFRSPLDAIIYNTTHENQVKLYTEAAQTMRGLLDVFSIISTDPDVLNERLKQDHRGTGSLMSVFGKTLDMIMLHLLSASATEKIQQHYLAYAKAHGLCAPELSFKSWYDDFYELEQQLQAEWEQSYAQLLMQSAGLEERLAWLEQHFFKLEIKGFDDADIRFKEFWVKESFLTILLNEILVNAFKYYSSPTRQPVVLEWAEREGCRVLSCRNPSTRSERTIIKGSRKGHAFLSALARKTGSRFTKPALQDDFVVEFGILNKFL